MDAVIEANEAIDSILKNNRRAILCILDIEKAFDHVNWSFLCSVLEKMDFGKNWIEWIRWCISTTSFSILVNSSPSVVFFRAQEG